MPDPIRYKVVINSEKQYSIVPDTELPTRMWREAGMTGTKEQCLQYIEEVWTDMKPSDLTSLKTRLGIR